MSLAKNINEEMHIKMVYNMTTFIKNAFQYQMANFHNAKTATTFAPTLIFKKNIF